MLVVDHGSRDATAFVAAAWADRLPLHLLTAAPGGGSSRPRNVGVAAARGEVVLFCDADDWVDPGWVRAMVGALGRADVVAGPMRARYSRPEVARWIGLDPDDTTARFLPEFGTCPVASTANLGARTKVVRAVGGFDETAVHGHDVAFSLAVVRAGYRLEREPAAAVNYRARESLWATMVQRFGWGRSTWANATTEAGVGWSRASLIRREAARWVQFGRDLARVRQRVDVEVLAVRLAHLAGVAVGALSAPMARRRSAGAGIGQGGQRDGRGMTDIE